MRSPRQLTAAEQSLVEIRTVIATAYAHGKKVSKSDVVMIASHVCNGLDLWTTRGKRRCRKPIAQSLERHDVDGFRL